MTQPWRRSGGWTAAAALPLLLAACATAPMETAEVQDTRLSAQIDSRGAAEAYDRAAYDRANRWWFPGAEAFYRDLKGADVTLVGEERRLSSEVNLAVSVANQGQLDQAAAMLTEVESDPAAPRFPRLQARAALAAAIVEGHRGRAARGAERERVLQASLRDSARAIQLLSGPGQNASLGVAVTRDETGAVVIGPAAAARLNDSRSRAGLGDIVSRPLTDAERAAVLRAHSQHIRAAALALLGRWREADAADQAAEAELAAVPVQISPWLRAQIPAHRGQIAVRRGDARAAEPFYQQAVRQIETSSLTRTSLEAVVLRGRAEAQMAAGDRAGALRSAKSGFDILSAQVDGTPILREDVDLYLAMLAGPAAAGDPSALSEFVRAASLAQETETARTIARVAARLSAANSEEAQALKRVQEADGDWRQAQARLARVKFAAGDATAEELAQSERAEAAARRRREAALASDALSARAQGLINEPVALAELQQSLGPDEVYLRYLFVSGRLHALLVSRAGASLTPLGAREPEVAKLVQGLRRYMEAQPSEDPVTHVVSERVLAFNLRQAHAAYAQLIGPLEPRLTAARRLIIEPAGPLFSAPFAALVASDVDSPGQMRGLRGDFTGVRWLGSDKSIQLSPGISAFVKLRRTPPSRAPNPILAFADAQPPLPQSDPARSAQVRKIALTNRGLPESEACVREAEVLLSYERLAETAKEAEGVAQRLGADSSAVVEGAAFTDVAIKSRTDLARYRVLYFATHGVLPNQFSCWPDPLLSTSLAAEGDAALDAVEIASLNLDADLVVLSACDTAGQGRAGDALGGGQALGGLAQSFAMAGSRGLLVSHWAVSSTATSTLMQSVFQHRAEGRSTAESLALAQAEMRQDQRLDHPYFWAGFILVGEGGGPAPVGNAKAR